MNTSPAVSGSRRCCLRALQRQQAPVELGLDFTALADAGLYVRQVFMLAGAVDDHEQVVLAAHEHQVVQNAARIIEQQAVALAVFAQAQHVHGQQRFQRRAGTRAAQADLAHVRDIEQACRLARVQMLGHQPLRVLHGHGVAGKRHHARAQFLVQVEQRGLEQIGGGGSGQGGTLFSARGKAQRHPGIPGCPALLSALPERFTRTFHAWGLLLRWMGHTAVPCISLQLGTPAAVAAGGASPFA